MSYLWTLLAGMFIGAAVLAIWQAPAKVAEAPAVAVRQADGSQVLERTATAPEARPAAAIPKGGKAERIIHGEIQPNTPNCPVCKFDLTLVQMPDHARRVVLWSETGKVLDGLDVPILPIEVYKKHLLAVGISRALAADSWGIWLDRDFGPLRMGIEINKIEANPANRDTKYEARAKIGLLF